MEKIEIQPANPEGKRLQGKRFFVIEGREFNDPNPTKTVNQIREYFAGFFPELTNCETKTVKRGDDDVTSFTKRVGTKGEVEDNLPVIEVRDIKLEDMPRFIKSHSRGVFADGLLLRAYSDSIEAEMFQAYAKDHALVEDKFYKLLKDLDKAGIDKYHACEIIRSFLFEEIF
jgi:PRTRC genetic system protein C